MTYSLSPAQVPVHAFHDVIGEQREKADRSRESRQRAAQDQLSREWDYYVKKADMLAVPEFDPQRRPLGHLLSEELADMPTSGPLYDEAMRILCGVCCRSPRTDPLDSLTPTQN